MCPVIDKHGLALDALKHLDLSNLNAAERAVAIWTSGFDQALDWCIRLEQSIEQPEFSHE